MRKKYIPALLMLTLSAAAQTPQAPPIQTALLYSTYWGGSMEEAGNAIALDKQGNVYVAGFTDSPDFPVTPGAFQTRSRSAQLRYPNGDCRPDGCPRSSFITKFSPDGKHVIYSTYFGDTLGDTPSQLGVVGMAVGEHGELFIAGNAAPGAIPTTANAFQRGCPSYAFCAFVAKLSADGSSLIYSTYIGGSDVNDISSMAVDPEGNVYIDGSTQSLDFPTTAGAFQSSMPIGGCVGINGGACPAGFISKINSTGSNLVYSSFLGGKAGFDGTYPGGLAVDQQGNMYMTGATAAPDFPVSANAVQKSIRCRYNAFVSKVNSSGSALIYSTYLGGSGNGRGLCDGGGSIAVNDDGSAFVSGGTGSVDFPITSGALQTKLNSGALQADPNSGRFLVRISADGGRLLYSSYADGIGTLVLDSLGNLHSYGWTSMGGLALKGAFQNQFDGLECLQSPCICPGPDTCVNTFLSGFSAQGTVLRYATYFGNRAYNLPGGIAIDGAGNAWVTGETRETLGPGNDEFPLTPDAIVQTAHPLPWGMVSKAFVAKIYLGPQDFALVTTSSMLHLESQGQSQTSLTLQPTPLFAQAVSLSCSSPAGVDCTINPASVTPGDQPQIVSLTVSSQPPKASGLPFFTISLLTPLVFINRKTNRRRAMTLLLVFAFCVMTQIGCGNPAAMVQEPSFNVVVTGQSGSIQHAVTLQVITRN